MDISYLGAGAVKLSGKEITILVDPYAKDSGLPPLKGNFDAVLLTGPDKENPFPEAMVIDGPGEYEVKGALITGIPARLHIDDPAAAERGTIYSLQIDGITTVVLGNIAPKLSDEQLEQLGEPDALAVPVGGHGLTLDAEAAAEVVSQLEPKFVIPVHYDEDEVKYPMPQAKVDDFLKEMGSHPEPVSKLKLNTRDLPLETSLVLLKPGG